jgi:hypothetical protein
MEERGSSGERIEEGGNLEISRHEAVIREMDLVAFWRLIITAVYDAGQDEDWQDPQDYVATLRMLANAVEGGSPIQDGVPHTILQTLKPAGISHTWTMSQLPGFPHTAPQS